MFVVITEHGIVRRQDGSAGVSEDRIDTFIGDYLQELLSPLFPLVMPAVESLWSYGETGYHSLAAAVVRQRYRREAMASAFRILGEGQLSLTKFLLVTDRDVDLRDFPRTLEHVLARTNPETDLYVFSNVSMDTLDYTGPEVNSPTTITASHTRARGVTSRVSINRPVTLSISTFLRIRPYMPKNPAIINASQGTSP